MRNARLLIAAAGYLAILLAFWFLAGHSALPSSIVNVFTRAFASFALLLAPLWFFGFGAAEPLRRRGRSTQIAASAMLAIPYFVFTLGTSAFYWRAAVIVIALPVLVAAFLGLSNPSSRITARDRVVLAVVIATYFMGWLRAAWPTPALALFPKLFLTDVVLYCFLVIRQLEGTGYSLIPSRSAVCVGAREFLFYFPFALLIGEATGFIRFHPHLPSPTTAAASLLVTFFLIALPEELFFRSVLQNLLETRLGRNVALGVTAVLFGLSHFNHGSRFNWRYVLLASIAGIFYGRAWRARRQVFASLVTHTAVDFVWSLWFR